MPDAKLINAQFIDAQVTDAQFRAAFDAPPDTRVFTPGRVNLIGEHIDYNGGMVLPTALSLGVTLAVRPRGDERIRIQSDKFDAPVERQVTDRASDHWSDYIVGAVALAREIGLLAGGLDVMVKTDLPLGAGLSSSAAVIVGLLKAARDMAAATLSDTEIAVLARRVENDFIGVPCGIMDQMAVAIAKPGQALALNTQSLSYNLVDLPRDYHMAVIHSGVFRQLSEGRYKIRKEECDAVKAALGRDNICISEAGDDARLATLSKTLQKRARHCVSEHARVQGAVDSLRARDMGGFGRLMQQSHISMRDDFEISLPSIDALVDDAVGFGALGARLTGGGFGGCIVACVAQDDHAAWRAKLLAAHPQAFEVA